MPFYIESGEPSEGIRMGSLDGDRESAYPLAADMVDGADSWPNDPVQVGIPFNAIIHKRNID
jgi:hypothetical protein